MSRSESEGDFQPLLAKLDSLASVPEFEINRITGLLKRRTVLAGDFFVRAGEVSKSVGFMVRGALRYYYTAADGREFIRHFCFGGHFVSSGSSLLTGQPSSYSIQALEDSRRCQDPPPDVSRRIPRDRVKGQTVRHC